MISPDRFFLIYVFLIFHQEIGQQSKPRSIKTVNLLVSIIRQFEEYWLGQYNYESQFSINYTIKESVFLSFISGKWDLNKMQCHKNVFESINLTLTNIDLISQMCIWYKFLETMFGQAYF